MSLDPRATAFLALHRFGLGPRYGALGGIISDPRGAILADIASEGAGRLTNPNLRPSDVNLRAAYNANAQTRAQRLAGKSAQRRRTTSNPEMPANGLSRADGATATPSSIARNEKPMLGTPAKRGQRIFAEERDARFAAALTDHIGVAERLVWFWSNHFCVSSKNAVMKPIVGSFEREAIRPHILGKFVDMLLAVESHPAMLVYLDNVRSVGPNSRIGTARGRGLNENLAREALELHTLGVRTVYTQEDVTSFAKVLTGWSIVPLRADEDTSGQFNFNPHRHEPGPQTVVGKTYAEDGVEQGRAVLRDVARHPATARHIATKLAIHFVADAPPQTLVDRLSARFLETDGDLKEVTTALLTSDEAWSPSRSKLKRPSEWIVSALRAVGAQPESGILVTEAQNVLGEPLWHPPEPKGFSDQSAEWTDGIAERLDIASNASQRLLLPARPADVLDQTLGPLASGETRKTIDRAADGAQALALLFMAPEFQMR